MSTHEEFSLAERELDQILLDIKKKRSDSRIRSKLFLAIPIVVTLALFTGISRAAAHYQHRLINTEAILKEKQKEVDDYKSRLNSLITQPQDEIINELNRLLRERETIVGDIDKAMSALGRLQDEIVGSNNSLVENLKGVDNSLQRVLSNDERRRQRLKETIDFLDEYKNKQGVNHQAVIGDALGMLRGINYDSNTINEARRLVGIARGSQNTLSVRVSQFADKLRLLVDKQRALKDINSQIDAVHVKLNSRK